MILNIVAAFILDFILGDPPIKAHPIRLIGSMLRVYERLLYQLRSKLLGGCLLVIATLLSVFAVIFGLHQLLPLFSLPFGINFLAIFLIFFIFCNRDMVREAEEVYRCLEENRITDARERVARIVGRDTEEIGEGAIIRATVESVAENVVDGFTAPLFYLAIGGIPLAYIYKTVNTIDSSFGYWNARFERFGKFGARLDDILSFIPARLNFFFVLCATGFKRDVFSTVLRYGRKHPSPNSGISEAAFAGSLGLSLGGPSRYGGRLMEKPWIGENRIGIQEREDPRIILKAVSLYWRITMITLIFHLAALYFLRLPLVFHPHG